MMVCLFRKFQPIVLTMVMLGLSGCYFVDYFTDNNTEEVDQTPTARGVVLGKSLGDRALGVDDSGLADVYAVTSGRSPALIRPDPDLFARKLLLQYREEGSTVARMIGGIEDYRELLGGASEDFSKAPQREYDATSLLATMKVSETVCEGLVNPNATDHPGWNTILPAGPEDSTTNLKFLAQRFIGRHSNNISQDILDSVKNILDSAASGATYTLEHYVSVCTVLSIDAEALLL